MNIIVVVPTTSKIRYWKSFYSLTRDYVWLCQDNYQIRDSNAGFQIVIL